MNWDALIPIIASAVTGILTLFVARRKAEAETEKLKADASLVQEQADEMAWQRVMALLQIQGKSLEKIEVDYTNLKIENNDLKNRAARTEQKWNEIQVRYEEKLYEQSQRLTNLERKIIAIEKEKEEVISNYEQRIMEYESKIHKYEQSIAKTSQVHQEEINKLNIQIESMKNRINVLELELAKYGADRVE